MKLEPRAQRRRTPKAAETLGPAPEQVELLFDVEKEVPHGEFEKYKSWLAGEEPTNEQAKKDVVASAWYGLLHPEYRELMRQSSWLKEFWVKYFMREMEVAARERHKANALFVAQGNLDMARSFVQVFPESRADLKLTEQTYEWIVQNFPPSHESEVYNTAVILLELWPERRETIISLYFPGGPPTELGHINNWRGLSNCLLLFPELRTAATSHLKQKRNGYIREISHWREFFERGGPGASEAFYDYLKNLAILAASNAWIDATGREHIEMPKAGIRHDRPLPERLTA